MKYLPLLLFSLTCFAAKVPSQEIVDQYVDAANQIPKERLLSLSGPYSCSHVPFLDGHSARGKSEQDAVTALQLLCIKEQCESLGKKVLASAESLQSMSDDDLRDFLEFSGTPLNEIEEKIRQIRNPDPAKLVPQNCETGSALFRTAAFDSCFSVPVTCRKD